MSDRQSKAKGDHGMTTTWKEVRAKRYGSDADAETRIRTHRDRAVAETLEYTLAELRRARELTQTELARTLDLAQSNVSRIENVTPELATLRRYIEGLGGHLELFAVFDDERFPIIV